MYKYLCVPSTFTGSQKLGQKRGNESMMAQTHRSIMHTLGIIHCIEFHTVWEMYK